MTCYICLQWFESINLDKDGLLAVIFILGCGCVRTGLITAATLNLNEIIEIGCKSEVTPSYVP